MAAEVKPYCYRYLCYLGLRGCRVCREKHLQESSMDIRNTTLDDIASVIGFSATLRLSAWFGDMGSIYVPLEVNDDQLLPRLIGTSAAKRLTEAFAGDHLAVPSLKAYELDQRRRLVGRMLEQGFGTREVSTHMRMSERRVQQIAREMEAAGLIDVMLPQKHSTNPGKS